MKLTFSITQPKHKMRIGDLVQKPDFDLYMICQVGVKMCCLIKINGTPFDRGNRFAEPVFVVDTNDISHSEMLDMTMGGTYIHHPEVNTTLEE